MLLYFAGGRLRLGGEDSCIWQVIEAFLRCMHWSFPLGTPGQPLDDGIAEDELDAVAAVHEATMGCVLALGQGASVGARPP